MRAVYGAEYLRHFPDVESVQLAKREWARQIGQFTREQIDEMFGFVKTERMRGSEEYLWLDIGAILAIKGSSWQHANQSRSVHEIMADTYGLPDYAKQERAKAAGEKALSDIKNLFGLNRSSAR